MAIKLLGKYRIQPTTFGGRGIPVEKKTHYFLFPKKKFPSVKIDLNKEYLITVEEIIKEGDADES